MELDKQTEIYEFLKDYTENKGYPPSIREICEAVSLRSTSTVHGHLKRLEKKGMIKRDPTKPRALEIDDISISQKEMLDIPILKGIKKGVPLFSKENIEDTFTLPIDYIKHNNEIFMIRVYGENMINSGIRNNDLAIIEKKETAKDGDIILTVIDNCLSIRRYYKENGYIKLVSENDYIEALCVEKCNVLGKLVGIYRSFI